MGYIGNFPTAVPLSNSDLVNSSITINGTEISLGGTVSLSNKPSFHASYSTNGTAVNDTWTQIPFNTELFDTDNCYDNSTNYRFTPTTAGKYFLYAQGFMDINTICRTQINISKNGTIVANYSDEHYFSSNEQQQGLPIHTVQDANGSSDYFEVEVFQNSGGNVTIVGDSTKNFFGGFLLLGV